MENKSYTKLEDLPENKSYYTKLKDSGLYKKYVLPVLVIGIPIGAILWGYFSHESSCKRLENSNKQMKLDIEQYGIEFQQEMEKIKQDDREMRERIRKDNLEVLEAYSKGMSTTDFIVQKAVKKGLVEILEK